VGYRLKHKEKAMDSIIEVHNNREEKILMVEVEEQSGQTRFVVITDNHQLSVPQYPSSLMLAGVSTC
jgi:hypothetical protein